MGLGTHHLLRMSIIFVLSVFAIVIWPLLLVGADHGDDSAAERGRKALLEKAFIPGFWSQAAYENVWKRWESARSKPSDYDAAVRERYGLHVAPYPNDGLPMGLRKARLLVGQGIGIDCMLCHGGSILGQSYVGLGNATLDIHALFQEFSAASGLSKQLPFQFCNVRGTNEAGAFAVYLLGFRNPDLTLRMPRKELGLHDNLCEDVPAWWLMKKKRTMYYTGATDADSVRSLMQFMMHPLSTPQNFAEAEATFRDIQAYLRSLEPPKYPFPIDAAKADRGKAVFQDNCAKCHGTYGEKWTYPNKIIPLDEIGTDPARYEGIKRLFGEEYLASWFGQEKNNWSVYGRPIAETAGYQAPPLDGIWATAPYFHNGSCPTLLDVLNSRIRPKIFTRTYRTGKEDYDPVRVGWKVQPLDRPPSSSLPAIERRKVYDTSQPGRSNEGHTYGDHLSDDERMALIEYLKTL